jgi:hypothetical protein
MKKTKIINFLGGPGVGKSTTASGIFSELKRRGVSSEYVSEYAKDVVWEETQKLLENQIHIFSEQLRRQWRVRGKVDYVVTDSPLILSSVYYNHLRDKIPEHQRYSEKLTADFNRLVRTTFDEFDNIVFEITRTKEYIKEGRGQTEEEARAIDVLTKNYCLENNIPTYTVAYETDPKDLAALILDITNYKK